MMRVIALLIVFAVLGAVASQQCKTDKDCPDLKCGSYCMNDASKKPPYFCHARKPDMGCCSDMDCPGSYCMNSPDKTPPFSCHGKNVGASFTADATTDVSDCRSNKTSTPINIKLTNGAGNNILKIKGCQDPKGFKCNPHQNCKPIAVGATSTLTIDESFKFLIFTFQGEGSGKESEMYPDANLKWNKACTIALPPQKNQCSPDVEERVVMLNSTDMVGPDSDIVIYLTTPGHHAHCTELHFIGGTNNAYYKAHGYQYKSWKTGPCPNPPYNWFNKNTTIANGTTNYTYEILKGIHS